MSLNSVHLIGFCSKEPEIKEVGGVKCATFSLPTTKKYKGKDGNLVEKTSWHNVVAWRNTADIVERFVKKSTQLFIDGEIDYVSWESNGEKKYMTNIIANNIQLLGSKSESPAQPQQEQKRFDPRAVKTTPIVDDLPPDDDALPF